MNLVTMLFGGYTPPDVPGRIISTDVDFVKKTKNRELFKEFAQRSAHRMKDKANVNAQRIREYLIDHPWATAQEIGDALGLTKSPVYNHLLRFRQSELVEVNTRKVRSYLLITYKWVGDNDL